MRQRTCYGVMEYTKITWPMLTSVIFLWLALIAHPTVAKAHSSVLPGEQTVALLEEYNSGPFTMEVIQYTKIDFTALEVRLGPDEPLLPEGTEIKIEAISTETAQSFHAKLIRHHNTFFTLLPNNGEDWQVSLAIESTIGVGAATVNVTPYRAQPATPLRMRIATFGAPFLLLLVVLLLCRRFGFSLMPKSIHHRVS